MNFPALSGIQAIQQGAPPVAPQNIEMLRGAGQAMGLRVEEDGGFENLFQAYLGLVNQTGLIEANAHNLQIDYALGKHDDMLAVIMAQEMAYTSLYFTVQVTNRVIEAYREIMRMQI